jgi:hypothetical protein
VTYSQIGHAGLSACKAVSVYGLGAIPSNALSEQWNKLLAHADELRTFLEANKSNLKPKEQLPR